MADYYVHTTGSDSNSGAIDSPFLTIQKAFDTVIANDRVIIYAGTYTDVSIGNVSTNTIKVCSFGDGLVVIDGSAGSGSFHGTTIWPRNNWVIDGSTGSLLQNIEIIGGTETCIGTNGTNRSFSVKHVILTGQGNNGEDNDKVSTAYGIRDPSTSTIRNCVIRNIRKNAIRSNAGSGGIFVFNNIIYGIGTPSAGGTIITNAHNSSEYYFNTIAGCSGSHGIDTAGNNGNIKNNLLAFNLFTDTGIHGNGAATITSNNVYTDLAAPSNGAIVDAGSGSISATNTTKDPSFKSTTPWDDLSGSNISGDFSLETQIFHYPDSARSSGGSELIGAGEAISGITTDFSGSSRATPPTIGALEGGAVEYLFTTAPTAVSTDKVLGDFTINHFNRISGELPRSVDQIPFAKALRGAPNLKDTSAAYSVEKGKSRRT